MSSGTSQIKWSQRLKGKPEVEEEEKKIKNASMNRKDMKGCKKYKSDDVDNNVDKNTKANEVDDDEATDDEVTILDRQLHRKQEHSVFPHTASKPTSKRKTVPFEVDLPKDDMIVSKKRAIDNIGIGISGTGDTNVILSKELSSTSSTTTIAVGSIASQGGKSLCGECECDCNTCDRCDIITKKNTIESKESKEDNKTTLFVVPLGETQLIPNELICILCQNMLYLDPVQTPCQHIFCKACLDESLTKCPVCSEAMTLQQVQPLAKVNRIVQRVIDNIPIKCSYSPECTWTGILSKLFSHCGTDCLELVIPCEYCHQPTKRGKIQHHLQLECSSHPVQCTYCGIMVPHDNVSNHDDNCERKLVKCLVVHFSPYEEVEGCGIELERRYLLEHQLTTCPKTLVKCEYGCYVDSTSTSTSTTLTSKVIPKVLQREWMVKHNAECSELHNQMILKRLSDLEKSTEQRIIDEVRREMNIFKQMRRKQKNVATVEDEEINTSQELNRSISPAAPHSMIIFGGGDNKHSTKTVCGLFGVTDLDSQCPFTWKDLPDMPDSRYSPTVAQIGEYVYVVGGEKDHRIEATTFAFHLPTWTWSTKSPPKHNLGARSGVSCNGLMYIFGGSSKSVPLSRVTEIYDPLHDKWSSGPSMLCTRDNFSSVVIGTQIFVIGCDHTAEVFNTLTKKWSFIASPLSYRIGCVALSPNPDTIWILGGRKIKDGKRDKRLKTVEEYRISTNKWSLLPWTLRTCLSNFSAMYHPVKKCLVIAGGLDANGKSRIQSHMRSDATNEWSVLPSLSEFMSASGFVSIL